MNSQTENPSRAQVLLRAAYDLLKKQDMSHYVLDLRGETAFYDGVDCDGFCLMEDIAIELNLEIDTKPLTKERNQPK